jgi:L-2-hydroxyglutarate oxidase LhgO
MFEAAAKMALFHFFVTLLIILFSFFYILLHIILSKETSSRNSEVIHAGLYYPHDSLKSKLCVHGKKILYQYCDCRHIPYRNCGKLVVATHSTQWEQDVPRLYESAMRNGVNDVRIISRDDVKVMEPVLENVVGALWSPSSGVLDSHSLLVSLLADAEQYGATVALRSNVQAGSVSVNANTPHSVMVDGMELTSDVIINCAGLKAHDVALMLHTNNNAEATTSWQPPTQYFAKGSYFRLQGRKNPFHHLVYPIPQEGGLGVHSTTDYSGLTVKFGPDVEWIDPVETTDPDKIDLNPNQAREESFYQEIRKYWPELQDDALVPDYAGIRPKLYHPQVVSNVTPLMKDFMIVGPHDIGIRGVVHLFGMESPGLTSCLAIADYVVELLKMDT